MLRLISRVVLALSLVAPAALAAPAPDQQAPQARPAAGARPAQAPRPDQTPPAPKAETAPAPAPRAPGQLLNVRVEFTITDQIGGQPPVKKTVSLLLADRESGRIRSQTETRFGNVLLNIDAEVVIPGNSTDKILTQVGMSYSLVDPDPSPDEPRKGPTRIDESLRTVLQDGKPLVISESADPITDRKVVVEVKATILR